MTTARHGSVLVVDDGIAAVVEIARRAAHAGVRVQSASPAEAQSRLAEDPPDLLLLDAWDLQRQQGDPTASRLASALDLFELVAALPLGRRPTVVGYSSMMARAEVAAPLAEAGADALFDLTTMCTEMAAVLAGDLSSGLVVDDGPRRALGLGDGARIGEAHQTCRRNPAAWRQVWDEDAGFEKPAQVWIRRNVNPLLPTPDGTAASYRHAVRVLRAVSGLPARI